MAGLLALMLAMAPAWAVFIDTPLKDPAAEARAQLLMEELRCLVCQNQSIRDSAAGLARDLRLVDFIGSVKIIESRT